MPYADIVGFDRSGQVKLIAEALTHTGVGPQWAAQLRRNLIAHGRVLPQVYFLLLFPDRLYLWKPQAEGEMRQPDYSSADIPKWIHESAGSTSASMEYAVLGWLNDLVRLPKTPSDSQFNWAVDSGLADALRGGRLVFNTEL